MIINNKEFKLVGKEYYDSVVDALKDQIIFQHLGFCKLIDNVYHFETIDGAATVAFQIKESAELGSPRYEQIICGKPNTREYAKGVLEAIVIKNKLTEAKK